MLTLPSSGLLVTLDLVGVFVFALSGALAAVRKKLDVFGVIVVGSATALGGGVLRDVLLGATPPATLRDWRYLAVAAVASVIAFYFHPHVTRLWKLVVLFDAAGLGLFTVTGTAKALGVGSLGPAGAVLLGVMTAIGGGLLRDVLLREIPVVLRREIYAVASLAGAVLLVVGHELGWSTGNAGLALVAGAGVLVIGLRLISVRRRWSAPTPRGIDG